MIRFIDVYKEYDNGTKALKGVNMRIDDGEFVFLVGPSGSGKSTIIKLITSEIAPTEGRVMVNGYNLNTITPRQVPLIRPDPVRIRKEPCPDRKLRTIWKTGSAQILEAVGPPAFLRSTSWNLSLRL